MSGNKTPLSTTDESSIMVYASYLLRYVTPPVTAGELRKKAASRRFNRLAYFFSKLPDDMIFNQREDILNALKKQTKVL